MSDGTARQRVISEYLLGLGVLIRVDYQRGRGGNLLRPTLFQIQERVNEHICEKCYENESIICPVLCGELSNKYEITVSEAKEFILYLKQ
jgi:hypothetical protein